MHPAPPKISIVNLSSNETLTAQFNPNQLEVGLKPVYNQMIIPGMSHTTAQFSHTENLTLSLELYFRVTAARYGIVTEAERALKQAQVSTVSTTRDLQNLTNRDMPVTDHFTIAQREKAESFLLACCVPRGATTVSRTAPPTVLCLWPNFLSFEARVIDCRLKYTMFNRNAVPIEMTATLSLEQVRNLRYTSDDIRRQGLRVATNPGAGDF